MKKATLFIFLICATSLVATPFQGLMDILRDINGNPVVLVETEEYTRIQMADNCFYDVYSPSRADTIVLIQTVCAPICSSCVRVYNKEWKQLRTIEPTCGGIFPEASYLDGHIIWHDNTPQYLDEEENKKRAE